jgi:nitroimidazol reductase NimA-like FMN-containing flavoprotein (pyridoxamine 5'-phosphate oxidase superfamily)
MNKRYKEELHNMNHEMRRQDRKIEDNEIIEILNKEDYGVLNTISIDGYPYGVPVNYIYCDNTIYIHCAANVGHKLENIKNNNKVSFTVVGKTQVLPDKFSTIYESVIAFGEATEITHEKGMILELFLDKYSPDFKEIGMKYIKGDFDKVAVYKIDIKSMSGKARKK